MNRDTRQLRNKDIQRDLRDSFNFRLLAGLNGRVQTEKGKPDPEALLPKNHDAIQRIEMLLIALQAATEPLEREEWIRWANDDLKRYMMFPVISWDRSSETLTSEMKPCKGDEWESVAVDSLLWLLNNGQLYRLKRCDSCEKWFYSLRDGQRFCSTACRQRQHSQSSGFRKKRKQYMRTYRESGNDKQAKSRVSIRGNRKREK